MMRPQNCSEFARIRRFPHALVPDLPTPDRYQSTPSLRGEKPGHPGVLFFGEVLPENRHFLRSAKMIATLVTWLVELFGPLGAFIDQIPA